MGKILKQNYHTKEASVALEQLKTSERGLTKEEAKRRLLIYGPNKLPEAKVDSLFFIYLRQFQSPLIYILLLSAVAVFLTGEKIDAAVILAVLFFNSTVGTIQEGKAQNIFLALKKFVRTQASVIREGEELIISSEKLVPGDVIVLRSGEKVPADARLFHNESLRVDEAALTGESKPKSKHTDVISQSETPLSDQNNMVFKGTTIVSGMGLAVITATGKETVIGDIAREVSNINEELPLKDDIRRLSHLIILFVIDISAILLFIGIFYGHSLVEIFSTIVAISVSVIPEGLPVVVTLVLATGVWRMGKRQVLIKKMQAVEALGQTSVIALDKTGTLTKNELTVREVYVGGNLFQINGIGYEPKGEVEFNGKTILPLNHPELLMAGKIGLLGSNANLAYSEHSGKWKVSGDPTEAATLVLAEKIGYRKVDLAEEFEKIDEKPFNNDLQYHATLYKDGSKNLLIVIGAPEIILDVSSKQWEKNRGTDITSRKRENLREIFHDMSSRGLRVVAFAIKELTNELEIPANISHLTFVGFFGLQDMLRQEVRSAVKRVQEAGIKLVMITGDHEITAKSIAKEAGIYKTGDKTISGKEVEEMTEEELSNYLDKVSVFSRVSPMHKLKIINAYKLRGETIAMTGDGINDALSLTSADVGVSMGRIGTEVAKEASDIILLDDNFGSIVSGIEEGKNIFRTIKKVILYLFSTSVGELLTIVGAIILGFPLPILAAQILWLNLVTDGFLDVALAMEPIKDNLTGKRSLKSKYGLVDNLMIKRIIIMAVPMAIGTLLLFSRFHNTDLAKAWTISLTTLAVFQWFNAWNCRSHQESIFSSNPFSNKFLVGATIIVISLHLLAVYNPFFQSVLRTVPLTFKEWLVIIPVAFSIILVEEIRKLIYRRNNSLNYR